MVNSEPMARKRRTPEQAQTAILDAAESLIVDGQGNRLRIRAVAERVGISHPAVLHHFGSLEELLAALHRRAALRTREDIVTALASSEPVSARAAAATALGALGDRRRGRVLAWLVAQGLDPFPPAEQKGLARVVDGITAQSERSRAEVEEIVEFAVLASLGDALFGDAVRLRLRDEEDGDHGAIEFRNALLARLLGDENTET